MAFALLLAGCGLKANPVTPESDSPAIKSEPRLALSIEGQAVVLTWRLQNHEGRVSFVDIEKSQLGSAGNICRDCPRTFLKIGQVAIQNVGNGEQKFSFTDSSVEKGKIYQYRLKMCDVNGACRQSQTVEIDFK